MAWYMRKDEYAYDVNVGRECGQHVLEQLNALRAFQTEMITTECCSGYCARY